MWSAPEPFTPTPAWVARLWDKPWLWMAIVIVFFCVPLFIGLGQTDFENDESIYSFAVDVMVQHGDWLTPKSIPDEHAAFLEKPPLKIWMVAAPVYLGWLPSDEFGYRFMDAVLASLAFLYVLAIGRMLAGPVAGLVAVLILFTMDHFIFQHGIRSNNMEASMLLAYSAGVYHFLAWRSVNPDAKWHLYAMSLWFVFGFMTKFIAVIFLPVILVLAALLTRADRVRAYRDWRTAVAAGFLAIALIAPWFVYEYVKHGRELVDTMFGAHVMKRFTSYLDASHLHPWNYYLQEIWGELEGGGTRTIVVLGALLLAAKTVRHRWTPGAVVVLWCLVPLAVMSSTTSKLFHYAYPFLPPLALAGGLLAAFLAKYVFQVLRPPFARFETARAAVWGRVMRHQGTQIAATAIGLASVGVAMVTYAFDRIRIPVGSVVIRNSHVLRPALLGLVAMFAASPAIVLRALTAATILLVALPVAAYHKNVLRTTYTLTPYGDTRACLSRAVADQVARGTKPPGVWVEATKPLSHIPFYYLRGLGPWQVRGFGSDATDAMHLLAPGFYRPLLLSDERYADFMTALVNQRALLTSRAAALSGVPVETIDADLNDAVVGITPMADATLLLPGPYATCGLQQTRLVSR